MQIGMLGPLEVRGDDGAPADVPGARLRGLLVALARQPGRVVPKAALIDWIWGENPPSDATNALHRLVSRLRKLLPDGAIEGHTDGYRLAVEPDGVDAVRFERLAAQARGLDGPRRVQLLREALGLWRGAALQDVGLTESPAFDAAVARLDGLRLAATEDRFEAETALGHGAEVVTELTDLVAAHPLRERLVAALMRALVAAGRDADALLVYERTREELADTLGADPSPELSALHVALLKGEVGRRDDDRRTNLRAELTSYIGKDADVAAVRELVGARRLTTLVGPGGSGKTRLATETARALLDDLPDGVWLVELASVTADGDVAQATVAALGLRDPLLGDQPDAEPADRLVAALRDREVLLVLDNCEHVIESAAALAHRLLGECPRLRILATSRESLGITGEALWPVVPLTLPDDDAEPASIEASPAVRLLLDRASAVRTDLTVDAAALATMARICRALDGMPLAIELAAARLRTMTLDQLAGRLDHRFRLLTSGSRTVLPRHQTLRAVVDWSWELLGEPERTVLRRLSVFTGGAGLDAAERVCAGDDVHPEDVLELLGSLTEKSLLVAEGGGAPRYRLLGTIKEYAAQRLAEAGETESARRAHLACFTELVEAAEPWLRRAEQVEWLATLDAEHGNIVAAMRGALAAGDAAAAMRLAASAGWYWWFSGHKAEGEELVAAAAAMPGEVDDETRALVYTFVAGFLTSGREDAQRAETWIREAHRLSPDGRSTRTVLRLLAPLERLLQGPDGAVSAWEPVLDDEDPWVRALARLQRGKMRIMLGDGGRDADADLEEALAQFRAIGERYGTSFALTELADRRAARGEFAAACALLEEAATAVAELGAVEDVIRIRSRQAQLYWLAGDEDASAAAVAEAQRHADRVTWPNALAELALARADLARWRGDADEARRQLAAAIGLLHDTGDQPHLRAMEHDLLGYLAAGDEEARAHRAAAVEAAAVSGYPALIAVVLVGVADLALRRGEVEQAVRLLAAGAAVRGMADRSHPDVARIEQAARSRLGDTRYAEAAREGTAAGWSELAEITLAS